jgi:hypothetical protein
VDATESSGYGPDLYTRRCQRKALQRVVGTAQYITGAELPAIQDLYTRRCQRKALQRVVGTAQYITGAELSAIQDLYTRRCQRKALKMVKDFSHPSHRLFSLLQHGKRYQRTKSGTIKTLNSFYPPKP